MEYTLDLKDLAGALRYEIGLIASQQIDINDVDAMNKICQVTNDWYSAVRKELMRQELMG